MKTYISALILIATAAVPAFAGAAAITPEPGTFVLIGGGLAAVILAGRWSQSRKKK